MGIPMLLAGSFRWLSTCCVGLFLMLTGYLKSDRTGIKDCYRALVPVLLGYLIAATISIPVRHFVFGDRQSLAIWLKRLFGFSAVYYGWYVGMYLGLTMLSPFLDLLLRQLREEKQLLGFTAVLLFLTALPGATPLPVAPDFWRRMYPLTYYVLARSSAAYSRRSDRGLQRLRRFCLPLPLGQRRCSPRTGSSATHLRRNLPTFGSRRSRSMPF